MNYIESIIEEQLANKKLFASIMEKWKLEKNNISEAEVESIINRFAEIKNGLDPKKPQVATFLFRYDGSDYPKFDKKYLKDITKYTYDQIIFLLSEYSAGEEGLELMDDDFGKLKSDSSDDFIRRSKALWEGENNAVVNENGFKVHFIPDQKTSIQYGYYLHYYNGNKDNSNANGNWCVTWRNNNNYWSNYRDNRTFYFLLDESKKGGAQDAFYLAALQRDTSTHDGYRLTSHLNDGDNTKTWGEIVRLYPQLENYKDAIANVDYDSDDELEREGNNIINRISETPGRYEFKRQPKNIKRRYIIANKFLFKPESWASMDNELRMIYINGTNIGNYRSKFSTYSLLMEVSLSNNEFRSLDHKLKQLGLDGVMAVYEFLMGSEFRVSKTNIENPNIKIYRSRSNNRLGIFDASRGRWYTKGGITYEPNYNESKPKLFKNAENPREKFFIITYSLLGQSDEHNFYCVIPIARSKTSGYLLSGPAYNAMKDKIVENDFMGTLPTSPESEHDID